MNTYFEPVQNSITALNVKIVSLDIKTWIGRKVTLINETAKNNPSFIVGILAIAVIAKLAFVIFDKMNENEVLKKQIGEKAKENTSLNKDTDDVVEENTSLNKDTDDVVAENTSLNKDKDDVVAENTSLKEFMLRQGKENASLRFFTQLMYMSELQLQKLHDKAQARAESEKMNMQQSLNSLTEKNDELRMLFKNLQDENAQLNEEIAALKNKLENTETEAESEQPKNESVEK